MTRESCMVLHPSVEEVVVVVMNPESSSLPPSPSPAGDGDHHDQNREHGRDGDGNGRNENSHRFPERATTANHQPVTEETDPSDGASSSPSTSSDDDDSSDYTSTSSDEDAAEERHIQRVQSSSRITTASTPFYRLQQHQPPQHMESTPPQAKASTATAAAAAATTHGAASSAPANLESSNQQRLSTPKPSTKAQHETISEKDDDRDDFELALVWQRNKRVLLGRLEESLPRGRLSLINLSRRGLGLEEALLLKHAIQSNQQLSVLKLGYNDLRDAGVVVIAEALFQNGTHHPKLSVLDLGFNDVGDAGVEALAVHALAGNYALGTLYLSGNQIGPKGAFSIAAAILHGTGLCSLHLAGNRVGAVGMKAIAGAIAESDNRLASAAAAAATTSSAGGGDGDNSAAKSMVELHVGNANIGSAGFIAIPGMLLSNTTLRSLSVTNNGIDDQAMLLLSQALSQNKNVPLETLHFSFNEITDQGVECLMNAVWGSQFLREIKLDNNKIQDRGAQLCAVALTSIPLEVLDLSFNRVTTTGIKALMKNISENDSLHTLGMSGITIDQHASKAVSFALAYNSSLNVLYLDNCSAGYSAQRHIVAGVVSNRRASLRVLTGFSLAPITMTLGMPRIPEEWSNEQVLGFVRLMWQQWLFKSGHGNVEETQSIRGPAPPAAVAAAAKIAFSSLGVSPQKLFQTETHDKPLAEGAPVDSASSALLERTQSGTLGVPPFSEQFAGQVYDWVEADSKARVTTVGSPTALSVPTLEDPEQRNRNLQWLRSHFRSLSEVGRLPFNNADLWQLHQYYFSPPIYPTDDSDKSMSEAEGSVAAPSIQEDTVAPPPTPAVKASSPPVGRAVSFRALGDALAAQGLVASAGKNNKRRSSEQLEEENGHATKRAKNLKPRVAYYPRLMAKIQSLGTRPMDQTLSLLRQLKYTENIMFAGMDPYGEAVSPGRIHRDIEMILVDLL